MELVALQVFLSLVVELIVIRSMCMVLDMRSNALYVVLHLCCYALSYWLSISGTPDLTRVLTINVLCNVVLPIAISRGPISSRIARTVMVHTAVTVSEFIAEFLYTLSAPEGSMVPRPLTEESSPVVFLIYCALVPIIAITQESVVVACRHIDDKSDYQIALPSVLLITLPLISYIPLIFGPSGLMVASMS